MAKKVLVVDDEEDLVMMIKSRLEHEGFDVDQAYNGKEAIGAFITSVTKKEPFDIILLDIMMPEVNGIEVLEAIRAEEGLRGIKLGQGVPIIILTALKQPFMDSFNKGCDDYIVKPFEEKSLLKKMKEKLK